MRAEENCFDESFGSVHRRAATEPRECVCFGMLNGERCVCGGGDESYSIHRDELVLGAGLEGWHPLLLTALLHELQPSLAAPSLLVTTFSARRSEASLCHLLTCLLFPCNISNCKSCSQGYKWVRGVGIARFTNRTCDLQKLLCECVFPGSKESRLKNMFTHKDR